MHCTLYLIAHLTPYFISLFVSYFILTIFVYIYTLSCFCFIVFIAFMLFLFYYHVLFFLSCTFHWADLSWLTFHYLLYPVWLCMWQIIKNLEPWTTVKLGILTWRVYGTDSLLEPASSGQSMNCSFKKLKKQKVVILRYYKHSMYNQCLYQTTFCWHNADMHDSTDIL